jgi:hypothetical protein
MKHASPESWRLSAISISQKWQVVAQTFPEDNAFCGRQDASILARLVQACSEKDIDKADKYAAMLPEVDSGDVDVQELETFTPQVMHRVCLHTVHTRMYFTLVSRRGEPRH